VRKTLHPHPDPPPSVGREYVAEQVPQVRGGKAQRRSKKKSAKRVVEKETV